MKAMGIDGHLSVVALTEELPTARAEAGVWREVAALLFDCLFVSSKLMI
jgi:hypothetical protein